MGKKKFNYGQVTTEPFYGAVAVAANGYSLPIVGQKTAKKQLNILPYFGKVVL